MRQTETCSILLEQIAREREAEVKEGDCACSAERFSHQLKVKMIEIVEQCAGDVGDGDGDGDYEGGGREWGQRTKSTRTGRRRRMGEKLTLNQFLDPTDTFTVIIFMEALREDRDDIVRKVDQTELLSLFFDLCSSVHDMCCTSHPLQVSSCVYLHLIFYFFHVLPVHLIRELSLSFLSLLPRRLQ